MITIVIRLMNEPIGDVGIGVLTWRAPETLLQTLKSHRAAGIDRLIGERVVFVQEQNEDQRSQLIGREFGYRVEGSSRNLGILGGIDALSRSMQSPLVLLNENDFQIGEPHDVIVQELGMACSLLNQDLVDIVMLRSRARPGHPFSARAKSNRFFPDGGVQTHVRMSAALRRLFRPAKTKRMAARSIRFDAKAHHTFPRLITELKPGWLMSHSVWLPWSNNPCLLRKDLLLHLLDRAKQENSTRRINGFKNLEIELRTPWWQAQNFRIAQGPGIFTHERIGDRGY